MSVATLGVICTPAGPVPVSAVRVYTYVGIRATFSDTNAVHENIQSTDINQKL